VLSGEGTAFRAVFSSSLWRSSADGRFHVVNNVGKRAELAIDPQTGKVQRSTLDRKQWSTFMSQHSKDWRARHPTVAYSTTGNTIDNWLQVGSELADLGGRIAKDFAGKTMNTIKAVIDYTREART
jgi:hypothetical protein